MPKSIVKSREFKKDFESSKGGKMYVFTVVMEDGTEGEYVSNKQEPKHFNPGEEQEYTASDGQYGKKLKPVYEQKQFKGRGSDPATMLFAYAKDVEVALINAGKIEDKLDDHTRNIIHRFRLFKNEFFSETLTGIKINDNGNSKEDPKQEEKLKDDAVNRIMEHAKWFGENQLQDKFKDMFKDHFGQPVSKTFSAQLRALSAHSLRSFDRVCHEYKINNPVEEELPF